jgi:flagellar biosynthesis/type III secretory pathway protein FliH
MDKILAFINKVFDPKTALSELEKLELETLWNDCYAEGKRDGYESGYDTGYDTGLIVGQEQSKSCSGQCGKH